MLQVSSKIVHFCTAIAIKITNKLKKKPLGNHLYIVFELPNAFLPRNKTRKIFKLVKNKPSRKTLKRLFNFGAKAVHPLNNLTFPYVSMPDTLILIRRSYYTLYYAQVTHS